VAMLLGAVLVAAPRAYAQTNNQVAAEALFREARKLLDAGQHREACEKLEASRRLDPAAGTLLNLARCREKLGQTATAWATYHEAIRVAKSAGQADREKAARERIAALEPSLPKLTIVVSSESRSNKVQLRRDGVGLPPEIYGLTVPVDPGEHVIDATASGRKPWSTKVNVAERASAIITVPELEPLASPERGETPTARQEAKPVEVSDSQGSTWNTGKTFAVVLGVVGVAGLAVGTVEWLQFNQKKEDAERVCPRTGCFETQRAEATTYRNEADSARTIAIASGVIGGASLVGAAVLWFTSGPRATSSLTFSPVLSARELGLGVAGAW
jgi:hypothetical protein